MEDLKRYDLNDPNSKRFLLVGSNLKKRQRTKFIEFLTAKIEVFAWTPYKIPGIDPSFASETIGMEVYNRARISNDRGSREAKRVKYYHIGSLS